MYDSYKRKVGATQASNYNTNCNIVESIVDDFFEQPGYTEVYRNDISYITYDAIIADGDREDKLAGYKRFLSYPYSEIQFNSGDYIHFNYGGDDTTWLLTSLDRQFTYNVSGRIYKCNNTLYFGTSATPLSYPCFVEDRINETEFDFEKVTLAAGDILVHVQKNADTETIGIDTKFKFGNKTWRTRVVKNFISEGVITLGMRLDYVDTQDTTLPVDPAFPWA